MISLTFSVCLPSTSWSFTSAKCTLLHERSIECKIRLERISMRGGSGFRLQSFSLELASKRLRSTAEIAFDIRSRRFLLLLLLLIVVDCCCFRLLLLSLLSLLSLLFLFLFLFLNCELLIEL